MIHCRSLNPLSRKSSKRTSILAAFDTAKRKMLVSHPPPIHV
ncbi:hypothetical protein QY97_02156 [Bacillus thermotolerans]|uniref:Uncharacterized protein n=1 Tax=Bacillus thermotolerans TaxID=1221996 RepID=A0A0F5HNB3_BACTR|nr:hypothetical protein QY97_02156 [Bacillus thermotolerans]KKB36320.1 hypothetical protein QY95_03184 [Bacillus thermotolerans]KKB44855.1 hypothetical protein QY96_01136 [Bacillus thermotolerans]